MLTNIWLIPGYPAVYTYANFSFCLGLELGGLGCTPIFSAAKRMFIDQEITKITPKYKLTHPHPSPTPPSPQPWAVGSYITTKFLCKVMNFFSVIIHWWAPTEGPLILLAGPASYISTPWPCCWVFGRRVKGMRIKHSTTQLKP